MKRGPRCLLPLFVPVTLFCYPRHPAIPALMRGDPGFCFLTKTLDSCFRRNDSLGCIDYFAVMTDSGLAVILMPGELSYRESAAEKRQS